MDNVLRHRRRPRFGLRTLFELIAVVAFILTLLYYRTIAVPSNSRYVLGGLKSQTQSRLRNEPWEMV